MLVSSSNSFHPLPNAALTVLLFKGGDRIPMEMAVACVRRGTAIVPFLHDIVREERHWRNDIPEFWAPVHATYFLGAIGGEEVITPLVTALRMADASECDWVTDPMASIFFRVGNVCIPALRTLMEDETNSWMIRAIAAEALGALALFEPHAEKLRVFDQIAAIVSNPSEMRIMRALAAEALMSCRQRTYHKKLLAFTQEEEYLMDEDPSYLGYFGMSSLEEALAQEEPSLPDRDWMTFYDEEEIEKRQRRWKEEARDRAWWFRPVRPLARWMERRKWDREFREDLEKGAEKEKAQEVA